LRGIRSNQTTVQPGLFGPATRLCVDVPAPAGRPEETEAATELARQARDAATGRDSAAPGPVQLNLAFREPLSAAVDLSNLALPAFDDPAPERMAPEPKAPVTVAAGPRTVVIAGTGSGPQAEAFARSGGWPLLAEVSSGARFGPNLVAAYRELLCADEFGGRVERAVVFGHPTLSREVPELLQRDGVDIIVVAATGTEWFNPGHRVRVFARSVVADETAVAAAGTREAREWLGRWVMTSRQLLDGSADLATPPINARGMSRAELAALRAPVTRPMLVDAVWRASWPHDRLVFGASRLIREADRLVSGKKIPVHANRGLAGIDGTVATAVGIALASQAGPEPRGAGTTRLLLGDLALLHDAGSLLLTPDEARPRLQVIVGNDGGGTIFDGLEVAASAPPESISRVLYTPQRMDFAQLAAAYGWEYRRAATRSELEQALTMPPVGPSILEVPLDR